MLEQNTGTDGIFCLIQQRNFYLLMKQKRVTEDRKAVPHCTPAICTSDRAWCFILRTPIHTFCFFCNMFLEVNPTVLSINMSKAAHQLNICLQEWEIYHRLLLCLQRDVVESLLLISDTVKHISQTTVNILLYFSPSRVPGWHEFQVALFCKIISWMRTRCWFSYNVPLLILAPGQAVEIFKANSMH